MLPQVLIGTLIQSIQPRLCEPLSPNMIAPDGVAVPSVLKSLDDLFCEFVCSRVMDWHDPLDTQPIVVPDDRWRLVSSLQKAIRRGDVSAAMSAAHACYTIDDRYLWRRLAICAVEDVLLGNLFAVACTLALAASRTRREAAGGAKVATWMAAELAGGTKDRSACNLCVVVDFDRRKHAAMQAWRRLPDADLARKASDLTQSVEDRMLAAWLLAGTKRFWNVNVPPDNDRPRTSLMRLMVESRMPLILYYVADRAAMRGGGCMFVSMLPIWQIIRGQEDENFALRTSEPRPGPQFGAVLASAYDMHTRDGRIALRRFAEVPALARALAVISDKKSRFDALCAAVFAAEGGRLNVRLGHRDLDSLHLEATLTELRYFGIGRLDDQCRLLAAIRVNLDVLHRYRAEAVAQHGGQLQAESSAKNVHPQASNGQPIHHPSPADLAAHTSPQLANPASLAVFPDFELERASYWTWEAGDINVVGEAI